MPDGLKLHVLLLLDTGTWVTSPLRMKDIKLCKLFIFLDINPLLDVGFADIFPC